MTVTKTINVFKKAMLLPCNICMGNYGLNEPEVVN